MRSLCRAAAWAARLLILACLLLPLPNPALGREAGSFEYFLNPPLRSMDHLNLFHRQVVEYRRSAFLIDRLSENQREYLWRVEAFSSPQTAPNETLQLELFAGSRDKAVRRLIDEVGLEPPPGGAVVRIYNVHDEMPPAVRSLFTEKIAGIAYGRFIAVSAENRPRHEVPDIVSHELVHAFVFALMGDTRSQKLPKWFHEGIALYLAESRAFYFSYPSLDRTQVSYSTKDYNDFRRLFEYLEHRLGRDGLHELIARCIREASVDAAFTEATGSSDFRKLVAMSDAWHHGIDMQRVYWFVLGFCLLMAGLAFLGNIQKKRREERRRITLMRLQQSYQTQPEEEEGGHP